MAVMGGCHSLAIPHDRALVSFAANALAHGGRRCVPAAAGGAHTVTACMGNPFCEFQLAAPLFVAEPTKHKEWLCGIPMIEGVRYVTDAVTRVDHNTKTISFGHPLKPTCFSASE